LMADGRIDEAVDRYARAIRLDPRHAPAHNNLGSALLQLGRPAEAVPHFQHALEWRPDYANALGNLGTALAASGQRADAISAYRRAIAVDSGHVPSHAGLAWLLATAADDAIRDPEEAVRLAERAATLTSRAEPGVLDVLAAAYAARGEYERALSTLEAAASLSPVQPLAAAMRARQALYAAGRPYRQP
jgi:Tfp pilus assembly protein PilF